MVKALGWGLEFLMVIFVLDYSSDLDETEYHSDGCRFAPGIILSPLTDSAASQCYRDVRFIPIFTLSGSLSPGL